MATKKPKTYWNYRILAFDLYEEGIKHITGENAEKLLKKYKGEIEFRVVEVYYKNNIPCAYGKTAHLGAETQNGILDILLRICIAFTKPTLWGGKKFPKPYKKNVRRKRNL